MKGLLGVVLLGLVGCASVERGAGLDSGGVRVAACQIGAAGSLEAALVVIEEALVEARLLGADVAVFPETCIYGWVNAAAFELADPVPGRTSERLGELAREYGMMIAIGVAEAEEGRLYDSALLIDSDGELLLKHRKVNVLSEYMTPAYTAGMSARESVVETRFGRIGMLVCADTFAGSVVDELADNEPDLVLVPYGWAAPEKDWPGHGRSLASWVAHVARTTGANVVGVDCVGEVVGNGALAGQVYGGQSVVCGPDGRVLGVMGDRVAQVALFVL